MDIEKRMYELWTLFPSILKSMHTLEVDIYVY